MNLNVVVKVEKINSKAISSNVRLDGLDFIRGLACISLIFYHIMYISYTTGVVDTLWANHTFWIIYQRLSLGTFVFVSGISFFLSTSFGINWRKYTKRVLKLGMIAMLISLVTYVLMPNEFVRFGVIHFFTLATLLALLFKPLKKWALVPGIAIIICGIVVTRAGLYPDSWLYITGLMNNRPPSLDYIPLIPWFGVYLAGMGVAHWLSAPKQNDYVFKPWVNSIIKLGKYSLEFYIIHIVVIYAVLQGMSMLMR